MKIRFKNFFRITILSLSMLTYQTAMARSPTNQELKIISAKISEAFKDPDSAKFSNVRVDDKEGAVCGLVNAKNSYGGYTGAYPFVGKSIMKGKVMVGLDVIEIGSSEHSTNPLKAVCNAYFPDAYN